MKKTRNRKTALRLEREIVRVLQAYELTNVEGGSIEQEVTMDSRKVCCA
jgi:hypothetical protein